jgi:hypothetical protein
MRLSVEELLARVRPYWPATDEYSWRQERSPERERLDAYWMEEWRRRRDEWRGFRAELQQDLPRYKVYNATSPSDAGFRCSIYLPARRRRYPRVQLVVGCMSMLAPVYMIYGLQYDYRHSLSSNDRLFFGELPAVMLKPAKALARRLESRFGVTALPPELAATPVPFYVDLQVPPHATLFHALFTSEPTSIP